ncbi:YicC/YloC family endoribonuclease [Gimibacter soli]|uniref:YicC family protein n=1 Tax=Gimibacter soli TaxID=3024400 RepID=A0AAE9XKY5_9PROT|nr:YicC/YloC family endoribonuclease [Gimibacter soli]WCL52793.1 YicC family protein [Gimibacter soli]
MNLMSMTGFARASGEGLGYRWVVEAKSVNAKGLEVRVKLPGTLDSIDIELKRRAGLMLKRGTLFVNINLDRGEASEGFSINEERLAALVALAGRYDGTKGVAPARLDGLLMVRGVIDFADEAPDGDTLDALGNAVLASVDEALKALVEARSDEGGRLAMVLATQLDDITRLTGEAETLANDRTEQMITRFKGQVEKMLGGEKPVADERLAQEIVLLAVKADIREELDRLGSHIEEARRLMADEGPVGRRLDFLCQEFNREANTLCSKSGDTALTRVGVELKTVIDQFREQIQNIE